MSIVKERPSDMFYKSVNRFNDAKTTGALVNDEFSKILILEGSFEANMVSRGLKTEEEANTYINDMPEDNYFNYPHTGIKEAKKTVEQEITVGLLNQESLAKRSQFHIRH